MPRSALQKAREAPSSTKARILAAAEEVFAARGFEGASTREIAASAGVNISSLHYHWESKETLYFAVFENIYDKIVALVESAIPAMPRERPERRAVIDEAMGSLFDFFAEHPNVAKLFVRRLLEATEGTSEIERDILLPAWRRFARWTYELGGHKHEELDAQIFMLTVNSVMMLFMLDSQQFVALLGDRLRSPALQPRLRAHIIGLVHTLLNADRSEA
jgi:AcrR family transcriptional regulator